MKPIRKWVYGRLRIIEGVIAIVTITSIDVKLKGVIRILVGIRIDSPHKIPQVFVYVIGQLDLFSKKPVSNCRSVIDTLAKNRKIELVVKIKDR